jgi:hypothetical protein
MRYRLIAGLAAALGGAPAGAAQSAPPAPFPVGERLVYEARWGLLRLGWAEMQVVGMDTVRGAPALHVRFLLQGGGSIYPIRNQMDSWIALSDTTSRRFVKDFNEKGNKRRDAYEIFPDSGYYREDGVDSIAPTSARPLDDAALFYFVRTLPLEPGRRYELNHYFMPDRNPVLLDVQKRDTLDIPAGSFPSIVVQPIIPGGRGILAESSNAQMWLTDDERRLIVQLKSRFPFGTITLRLDRVESGPHASP